MIGIIDYDMGNLRSVQKALEVVGAEAEIITTPAEVERCSKLILPGVGAFQDAAHTLRARQMIRPILDFIKSGRPFLGICLGLQLLFDVSYEDGQHTGLGVVTGKVIPFDFPPTPATDKLKVPHMGWNQIYWDADIPLLHGITQGAFVYFVHSYFVVPVSTKTVKVTAEYGIKFTAMIQQGNVFATQFHPEKSQKIGLKILENFARL